MNVLVLLTTLLTYNNGNRNNYLYQLACNCNRRGISHPEAEHLITSNFYHENQTEIRKSIESAYQNNLAEFGKFANLAGLPKKQTSKEITNDSTEDYLKTTPTIPVEAIILMPNLISRRSKSI
jgi:galactokinase/mevalonate kinase-like predicted kinase